jgi:hypothetical protein
LLDFIVSENGPNKQQGCVFFCLIRDWRA